MNYDALLALMKTRRSIRRYSERAVSREDLARLLEAARWAPSNHNRQPWRFLVLQNRERLRQLGESVGAALAEKLRVLPELARTYAGELAQHATVFVEAPVLIVAMHKGPVSVSASLLAGLPNGPLVSGEPLSVAMAVQNLVLAAHAVGLGTCVLTAPLLVPEAVGATLRMPAGFEMTCFIALGHPAESPEPPRRKSLEQITEYLDCE